MLIPFHAHNSYRRPFWRRSSGNNLYGRINETNGDKQNTHNAVHIHLSTAHAVPARRQ